MNEWKGDLRALRPFAELAGKCMACGSENVKKSLMGNRCMDCGQTTDLPALAEWQDRERKRIAGAYR